MTNHRIVREPRGREGLRPHGPDWPLARARNERWFLRASGELTPDAGAADEPPSTFCYDPADPVPTVGGLDRHRRVVSQVAGGMAVGGVEAPGELGQFTTGTSRSTERPAPCCRWNRRGA